MPMRQHQGSAAAGSSREQKQPRVKAEPCNDVIDLCDSEDDANGPTSRPHKPSRTKYQDEGFSGSGSDSDDFLGSTARNRKSLKRTPLQATRSTPKLYAIARVVTLATDGIISVSESEAKLAGVNSGILSRIQKSLALAKHPGTGEAEAQQALRLATRLMSSQNLTQADLLASSDAEANQARAGMSIVEIVSQTNASPRNESWVNQLAVAVNLFFDVKAYSTSYANRTKLSWTFYGLAVNTVAAAHAFEIVHNQVLTWAYDKAAAKLVCGKTGKNSYCQGVAAGLIALAKKEKKQEMSLAIEAEKKRLRDAEMQESAQVKRERDRLDLPVKSEARVKAESPQDEVSSTSTSRNVKLEDVQDEQDVKPFKRSASQEPDSGYSRWTTSSSTVKPEHDFDDDSDHQDFNDRFYDFNDSATPAFADDFDQDVKPHFDEALERDIIDLTHDLDDDNARHAKPKLELDLDVKPKLEPIPDTADTGAAWQSSNQLIQFRQDAQKIADDYLASQHSGLKLKKRAKSSFRKDSHAFEQGRNDASKIDVKRKRLQM